MGNESDAGSLHQALVAARAEMHAPKFDAVNPHFKSKYVSLSALIETAFPVLAAHGVTVLQVPTEQGLQTTLIHKGGAERSFVTPLPEPEKATAQAYGSTLTYMRRYVLAGLLGLAGEQDDDANAAGSYKAKAPQAARKVVDILTAETPPVGEEARVRLQRFCAANGIDYQRCSDWVTKATKGKKKAVDQLTHAQYQTLWAKCQGMAKETDLADQRASDDGFCPHCWAAQGEAHAKTCPSQVEQEAAANADVPQ